MYLVVDREEGTPLALFWHEYNARSYIGKTTKELDLDPKTYLYTEVPILDNEQLMIPFPDWYTNEA